MKVGDLVKSKWNGRRGIIVEFSRLNYPKVFWIVECYKVMVQERYLIKLE